VITDGLFSQIKAFYFLFSVTVTADVMSCFDRSVVGDDTLQSAAGEISMSGPVDAKALLCLRVCVCVL